MKPQTTVTSMVLGALLLASNPAGAAALTEPSASSPSCKVEWTGNAGNGAWSTAANWSTHKVPGPTSDVCIPLLTTADATATPSISVHSIQVSEGGSLLFGSGKVSIATSLINQGGIFLYGTTLSAGSIDLPAPGEIDSYDNSSITSPAFSNAAGTVYVGTGATLRLADNPVQLQNETLSGGDWWVAGALIVPSDISQLTSQGTGVTIDGIGSAVQDASGNNALATLTSVGPGAVLDLSYGGSLTIAQGLTSQGVVNVGTGGSGSSLTVSGTYTQASGATTNMGAGSLSATSVIVQAGSTLQGSGTVASSITNNGTVAPGSLTVTGNYTQTGGAALTEYFGSTLHVNSNATVSGALNVMVSPKRPPKPGATYTALTAGSLNGSFTRHTAGFTLTTSANNIQVTKQ